MAANPFLIVCALLLASVLASAASLHAASFLLVVAAAGVCAGFVAGGRL